jgi:type IV pilus assembly protein PilY1
MASTATPTEVADLINWARSARMGAPLHTQPLIIDYGSAAGEVLYFSTNQGLLHAIDVAGPSSVGDTNGGSEFFAFMPFEMVGTLAAQRADTMAGSHIYGLDGPLSSHIVDLNGNGKVDATGEKAYIFFGMRRGGTTYYAMDVTNPSTPRLAWKISAGQPGFERLGQTWSRMTPATISDGGTPRSVIIFAGGYDVAKQDIPNTARDPAGDDVGMGVYIVDAMTGALLNSFGADDPATPTAEFMVDVPGMKYSMPADVRVEDTNVNGIADRLYMVDLGAQIWRADIEEDASISASSTVVPYLMADFSGISAADNRRFFYPPSVAIAARDGQAVTVLGVGSGYRAHPLNMATDDKFFVLFDPASQVGTPATIPAFLTMSSLYDATPNTLQTATGTTRDTEIAALGAANGWFIDLAGDQKVLVSSRIFDYKVFFNTFSSGVTDPCDYRQGVNRFFAVNLLDATAEIEVDVDDDGEPDDLVRDIVIQDANSAIVSEPTIVTHAGTGPPTSAQPICSTVFAGSAPMMQICEAPVRVNWQTVR